jgi:hypothetical protein
MAGRGISSGWRAAAVLLVLAAGHVATVSAQTPPQEATVAADPIRCWWRTSAGAVRIGETFALTLTCAVLDTEAVRVEPDESRLGANVIQMAPFEVVDGIHPADLFSGQRRFFQYQYTLRIINPDVMGADVPLPPLAIRYRISSRVAANASMQGRDLLYVLPAQSVKVLSTVPVDAPDIRDASGESFAGVEALAFRARALQIAATSLAVLAFLIALASVIRLLQRTGRVIVGARPLSGRAMLAAARREIAAVQREREQSGWNQALVGRAAAATRVAGAVAIDHAVSQVHGNGGPADGTGRISAPGLTGRSRATLSSSITSEDLARRLAKAGEPNGLRESVEPLQSALAAFTRAQYGRDAGLEGSALDQAAAAALEGTGHAQREHSLIKTLWRRVRSAVAPEPKHP